MLVLTERCLVNIFFNKIVVLLVFMSTASVVYSQSLIETGGVKLFSDHCEPSEHTRSKTKSFRRTIEMSGTEVISYLSFFDDNSCTVLNRVNLFQGTMTPSEEIKKHYIKTRAVYLVREGQAPDTFVEYFKLDRAGEGTMSLIPRSLIRLGQTLKNPVYYLSNSVDEKTGPGEIIHDSLAKTLTMNGRLYFAH